MIAVEHMDYGALKLVKGEVDINLLKAHDALDAFRKNSGDTAPIKSCITLLHQVHGAMQVLDFTWASVLAGGMERVACALAEDPAKRTDWAYDTLTKVINEFPKYFAKLQEGHDAAPLMFIPLVNDLRVAAGNSILSEAMIFSPENILALNALGRTPESRGVQDARERPLGEMPEHADASIPSVLVPPRATQDAQEPASMGLEIKAYDPLDVRALAGRTRPVYQTGLLVWYRDAKNKTALRRLLEVMVQLQQASPEEGLWCAAGEVIEKLLEGNLECSTSIKLLLGQVERQIRRVMEVGPEDLLLNPPTDLIKNLLHYITVAENKIDISSGISSSEKESDVKNTTGAKSALLLDMATKAVKDELNWAKKKLDDFAQSSGLHTQEELRAIMDVLRRVSGTLDMLGRWELRQRVRRQAGILDSMLGEESILNDPRIMEVANALLYVESLLGDQKIPHQATAQKLPNDLVRHIQPMREEEYHELCRVIIREVMVELTQVKDDIIAFSKDSTQCDLLTPVPALMHRIIGALTMLSLRRPTIVLKAVYHYISHELLGVRIAPSQEALDSLADILTSVEFFLETMVESQMNLDSLLDMAEGNIITLGYLVDRIDEMVVDGGASSMLADEHEIIAQEETIVLSSPSEVESLADGFALGNTVVEIAGMDEPPVPSVPGDGTAGSTQGTVAIDNPKNDTVVMAGQNEEVVDEIIEIFVEEATEAIGIIQQYYPKWKNDIDDMSSLSTFRRSFHTLKGSGRLVGANVVGELSWAVESLLNMIIEGEVGVSDAIFNYLEECMGMIPALVEKFQVTRTKTEINADIQALIDKSKALMAMPDVATEADIPVIETAAPLSPIVVVEEAPSITVETHDMMAVGEIIEAVEVPEFKPPVVNDEPPAIDPVLLEIFTNESTGRLKEIRAFIDHCHKSHKSYVTEPLARNLHTLQGSAHMSGFMEIAELGDLFERHINFVDHEQREITAEELSALNDFIGVIDTLLKLKHPLRSAPDVDDAMARQCELMAKMHTIMEGNYKGKRIEDTLIEGSPPEINIPEVKISAPSEDDPEHDETVIQVFLEEAAEILENTEAALQEWMRAPGVMAPMARLERELHTFKGGARMARITPMGDLSHSVESLLSAVVAGTIEVTDEIIQLLQQSHDQLHDMLDHARKHEPVVPARELIARLEALAGSSLQENASDSQKALIDGSIVSVVPPEFLAVTEEDFNDNAFFAEAVDVAAQQATAEPSPMLELAPSENLESPMEEAAAVPETFPEREFLAEKTSKEQVRIKAETLDNLVNQAGELSISRSRLEQQITTLRFGLNEMKQTIGRLREKIRTLDIETEAQILFRYQEISNQGEEFDPLEFDRFSLVQQLSRGMMEGTSDLSSIQDQFEKQVGDAEALLAQQSHMNTELQEIMMSTRLLPFSGVASRMKRLVRQISRDTGKFIDFDVTGEDVEMDRTVLEKIIGPLEHMVRNAIDHGIEDSEKRRQSGKPDKGNISLSLTKEGVEMVLTMSDDGAGFNFPAIRRKAIERGLVGEREVVDDQALIQFVLGSGFSTADKVTQISGRGVGMDVVNNEIKQLGGSLHIETKFGQGSTFTVRLPVALSIARALVVKEYGNMYAILNSSIDGVMRVDHGTLMKAFGTSSPALEYGSEHYPIHSLHSFLEGELSSPPDEQPRHLFLMVRGGGQRAALRVDSFVESREVVVKSLGQQLGGVRGMMGATIMGNGSVVLILDIPALLRISISDAQSRLHNASGQAAMVKNDTQSKLINVMVVDDSITVRKVTSRLLERHHMRVITAKDGIDAIEVLQHHMPDVMLLDIEMPRMDGFELASVIRNDERLKRIPIIMITSRTGDKHRDHALRIGVNKYLGKPYQEGELMENIRELARDTQGNAELEMAV